jgi:DNA repair ATPase RecN
LRQQEKFTETKEKLAEMKTDLNAQLRQINSEKCDLEDRIAEYEARIKEIENLKNAAIKGPDDLIKFNEKFLDSYKKSENIKMMNMKLDRANRRYKDEVLFNCSLNLFNETFLLI